MSRGIGLGRGMALGGGGQIRHYVRGAARDDRLALVGSRIGATFLSGLHCEFEGAMERATDSPCAL
jgi:hypothetical protein